MQFSGSSRLTRALLAGLLCLGAQAAQAANYPLELTNIKPAGSGLGANNRIYRAYPGIAYNIRAGVVGGALPFTFSLTNAPAGMTINAQTGEINWLNPQAAASPTITVVDAEGSRVTATWSIAVTTTGFRFIDGVNGRGAAANGCTSNCGAGTLASPWRTISDMYRSAPLPGVFVYFRNGTYNILDLPRNSPGTAWERVEFSAVDRPNVWIAFPGERPVINFGWVPGVENGPILRLRGDDVYVDGFETINSHVIALQIETATVGAVIRRMRMHHHGPGGDGTNGSLIMTTANPAHATGMVIQDSEFYDSQDVAVKWYTQTKALIEDCTFHDMTDAIEVKGDVRRYTIRRNRFYSISDMAIGGNMHDATSGEISYNNVNGTNFALDINQDAMAVATFIHHNTLRGRVQVRNTDSADGPFTFSYNVIVNDDAGTPNGSHIYQSGVTDPSRIVLVNNLVGFPSNNIIDGNGNLTTAYSQYRPTHGHGASAPVTSTPIGSPQNVRIVNP